MSRTKSSLNDDVLAAFERACREDDLAVAEHLLQALETMARRDDDEAGLCEAYLSFGRQDPGSSRSSRS